MKKAVIVILIILGLSLCSNIALAYTQEAKAGNFIPLRFTNTHITTSGWPIIGQWTKGWEPARVRFYLIDPYGHVAFMRDVPLSSVRKLTTGIYIGKDTDWEISADGGLAEIPTFAPYGLWKVQACIYDINKIAIIQWSNTNSQDIAPIYVGESSTMENLNAPYYIYINLGSTIVTGNLEWCFATPDLILVIGIIVVIFIILLNVIAFIRRRRK
jgi:hypothetical protein